jgi:hypothetical protein
MNFLFPPTGILAALNGHDAEFVLIGHRCSVKPELGGQKETPAGAGDWKTH